MEGQGSQGNTWAEQWDVNSEPDSLKQQQQHHQETSKEGRNLTKKLGESFNKTKEGATKSIKKVKDGASVSLFWIKDKCRKKPAE